MPDIINEIPPFLHELLCDQYRADAENIEKGYTLRRLVTLRVNTLKTDACSVQKSLEEAKLAFGRVEWYRDAFFLKTASEEELRRTDLYEKGEIYLQSLSSMLPPLILNAQAGESVLDMTAAPGSKTTQISALSGGKALITACERDAVRFERLRYNIGKQGVPRVTVLHTDALKLDEFFRFDKILLDAPCSGSGTLDLRQKLNISPRLVENSAVLQEKLLFKALKLLKKGGILVYSTCSVLRRENEDVLERVLPRAGGECEHIEGFEALPLLPSAAGTLCVCPTELYEGFFVAKIRKK